MWNQCRCSYWGEACCLPARGLRIPLVSPWFLLLALRASRFPGRRCIAGIHCPWSTTRSPRRKLESEESPQLRQLTFAGRLGCRKEGTEDPRCHSGARAVLSALLRGGLPCGSVGIPVLKSSNPELFRRSCRSSTMRRRAALSCSK